VVLAVVPPAPVPDTLVEEVPTAHADTIAAVSAAEAVATAVDVAPEAEAAGIAAEAGVAA
jgi:hypothetical protein